MEEGMVIGYNYRSFVCFDFLGEKQLKETYGGGVMLMFLEQFSRRSLNSPDTVIHRKGLNRPA